MSNKYVCTFTILVTMCGQNIQNPNPKNLSPNPKNPSSKNPNSNSGSNPRYPKLLRVIRVSDHSTRITQKTPILKKSYLKFYLVLAISAQSAQILVASHGPRRPKPYPESSFLTVKTQNKKNLPSLSSILSRSLSWSLDISLQRIICAPWRHICTPRGLAGQPLASCRPPLCLYQVTIPHARPRARSELGWFESMAL